MISNMSDELCELKDLIKNLQVEDSGRIVEVGLKAMRSIKLDLLGKTRRDSCLKRMSIS